MDNTPALGSRQHFSRVVYSTPTLLVVGRNRGAVVIYNDSGQNIKIGSSGTVSSQGMTLRDGQSLSDNYSADEWWAVVSSGSGTVNGFEVV